MIYHELRLFSYLFKMEAHMKTDEILIPADCLDDFKRAMKIGYYKMMKSKSLITESQFQILMQMQTAKVLV